VNEQLANEQSEVMEPIDNVAGACSTSLCQLCLTRLWRYDVGFAGGNDLRSCDVAKLEEQRLSESERERLRVLARIVKTEVDAQAVSANGSA
jgi:hypothetical protein